MILRMPVYCKNFRCTAEKCSDNCCIGWEIDIDPSSADYYKSVDGAFGERLKKDIVFGEVCSFKMKGERCAFLNEKNLCDIIINLGEDSICQICRDHPRYFEWYSDVKEGGVGLCCEEGARLIISQTEKFSTYDIPCDDEGEDDYDEELYEYFLAARGEIIRLLQDESLSLGERLSAALSFAHYVQENADNYNFEKAEVSACGKKYDISFVKFLPLYKDFEIIDDKWKDYLERLIEKSEETEKLISDCKAPDETISRYLENIAVYFIWRYFMKGVFDEEILSKVWLSVISTLFIERMFVLAYLEGNELTEKMCSELAKNYSKEIEYSNDNLESICDMVYKIN